MAKIAIKSELDSSGVQQGAQQVNKELAKIKRQAELSAKGLKSLANEDGINAVKEQFAGLSRQMGKFSKQMTSGLGIKQQSRQIAAQLAEVASVYRNMSSEEKASAAGQYLKQYMQELTVVGGKAKDTVQDMQKQINAMSSDAPILAGLTEGIGLLANGFTIAKGAAASFGMDEKKLVELQKQLTSLMAISNAAMQIKNALVNQGALMTAYLNVKIKANVLLTELQAAASTKASTATKAVAVAQALWNKALKANPLILIGGLIVGAIAAIVKLTSASSAAAKAAKEHAEAEKKRRQEIIDMGKAVADAVGKQIGQYKVLIAQWNQLKSVHEKNQWIKDNQKAFNELGLSIHSVVDAEEVFIKKTDDVIKAMIIRAQMAAHQAEIEKLAADYIHRNAMLEAMFQGTVYTAGQKVNARETNGLKEGIDYTRRYGGGIIGTPEFILTALGAEKLNKESMERSQNNLAYQLEISKNTFEKESSEHINAMFELQSSLDGLTKGMERFFTPTGNATTTTTGKTGRTTTTTKNDAVKGSLEWYDQEIKKQEDKLKNAVDSATYQGAKNAITRLKNEKFLLNVELNLGKEEADKLFKQLGEPAKNTQVGSYVQLPTSITTSNPLASLNDKHTQEGISQAQEQADKLLKSTEGLRMGAEGAANAFSALGNAIGGSAGKAIDIAGVMAGAIATMIQAYATAIAGAAKLGPWAWIAFGLTGLAQLAGMIATVKQLGTYAEGGIVQGNGSFYAMNDGVVLRSHQGEMLLNKVQQRKLFDRINSGFDTTGNGKVEFFISGRNLKGVLNNYNDKLGRL